MDAVAFRTSAIKGGMETAVPELICLIILIPPSLFLLDDRVFMSLGILRIAAVLEKAGTTVDVLDFSGIANYLDVVVDYIKTT